MVRERVNNVLATQAILQQAVIGAALNGKAGAKNFNKMIKELTGG